MTYTLAPWSFSICDDGTRIIESALHAEEIPVLRITDEQYYPNIRAKEIMRRSHRTLAAVDAVRKAGSREVVL